MLVLYFVLLELLPLLSARAANLREVVLLSLDHVLVVGLLLLALLQVLVGEGVVLGSSLHQPPVVDDLAILRRQEGYLVHPHEHVLVIGCLRLDLPNVLVMGCPGILVYDLGHVGVIYGLLVLDLGEVNLVYFLRPHLGILP